LSTLSLMSRILGVSESLILIPVGDASSLTFTNFSTFSCLIDFIDSPKPFIILFNKAAVFFFFNNLLASVLANTPNNFYKKFTF